MRTAPTSVPVRRAFPGLPALPVLVALLALGAIACGAPVSDAGRAGVTATAPDSFVAPSPPNPTTDVSSTPEPAATDPAAVEPVAAEPLDADVDPAPVAAGTIALVATDGGLAGVPVGTSTPRWTVPGAVAAPDGSAIFAVRTVADPGGDGFEVVRVDPETGSTVSVGRHVPGPAGIHVAAVAPGGGRIALVAPGRAGDDSTLVLDFDPATGGVRWKQTFEGTVEPEAFSLDGSLVFAARIYDDRYHVHVLEPATGEQWPTAGRDKAKPPEDMYGTVIQAALSPDGRQLATLYRDPTSADHTAFVHLLALDSGLTECIDLYAPFGTSSPGTDAIAWQPDGTVAVGHVAGLVPGARTLVGSPAIGSVTAVFDPATIWRSDPQPHYHADAHPDPTPPRIPDGLAATPGFRRFVALAG
jgi:PQQ-like domain